MSTPLPSPELEEVARTMRLERAAFRRELLEEMPEDDEQGTTADHGPVPRRR